MLMGCYLREGKVYVPVQAKTEAGFYMDIEPVEVAAVPDTEGLRRALLATYARGNPGVPTPARNERSRPVVLRHAGVKSWARFAHNADVWQMDLRRGACRIIGQQRSADGGWVDDPDQVITFPPDAGIEAVVERLVTILQAVARDG